MRDRIGWWLLAALSALLLVASAAAGLVLAGRAILDRTSLRLVAALGIGGVAAAFWWWILTSVRHRLAPSADAPPTTTDPIGPWGVVGRALLAVTLLGVLALWVWADLVGSEAVERAEAARDEAVRLAEDLDLTVDDVEAARIAALSWAWGDESAGPDPFQQLLPLEEGTVADVAVDGDRASILIRTDDSPPCAAVDITHGDIVRGRLTDRC